MININTSSIIYVLCPAYSKTGGPELLHQLVNKMKKLNYNVKITYYNISANNNNYTNEEYKKYIDEYIIEDDIVDDENNIIIFPEVYIKSSYKFKKIRKCIWWLSVDNYIKAYNFKECYRDKGLKRTFIKLIKGDFYKINLNDFNYHLCQSYYAMDYLKNIGINKCYYLSDYINSTFFKNNEKLKNDNVLYNPKKGYEFTKKLIKFDNNLKWIPIKGLTTSQVGELLSTSKVYVDFGNHPGKDRFPREAAISGCCVITGKRGSASFYNDVMIEEEFKFDDVDSNIPLIINKIKDCIKNYDYENLKFAKYKNKIINEEKEFEKNILEIFIKES